jgi:hypothetical protein
MGSSISKIYDELAEKEWDENKKKIEQISEIIKRIHPTSSEFRDLMWLHDNYNKILRNRKLIDLIG